MPSPGSHWHTHTEHSCSAAVDEALHFKTRHPSKIYATASYLLLRLLLRARVSITEHFRQRHSTSTPRTLPEHRFVSTSSPHDKVLNLKAFSRRYQIRREERNRSCCEHRVLRDRSRMSPLSGSRRAARGTLGFNEGDRQSSRRRPMATSRWAQRRRSRRLLRLWITALSIEYAPLVGRIRAIYTDALAAMRFNAAGSLSCMEILAKSSSSLELSIDVDGTGHRSKTIRR
jgi:hypothetical protein